MIKIEGRTNSERRLNAEKLYNEGKLNVGSYVKLEDSGIRS